MTNIEPRKLEKNEYYGQVKTMHPGSLFYVKLDNGHVVKCTLGGRMRHHKIRIWPGDKVIVLILPYKPPLGSITYRLDS